VIAVLTIKQAVSKQANIQAELGKLEARTTNSI